MGKRERGNRKKGMMMMMMMMMKRKTKRVKGKREEGKEGKISIKLFPKYMTSKSREDKETQKRIKHKQAHPVNNDGKDASLFLSLPFHQTHAQALIK